MRGLPRLRQGLRSGHLPRQGLRQLARGSQRMSEPPRRAARPCTPLCKCDYASKHACGGRVLARPLERPCGGGAGPGPHAGNWAGRARAPVRRPANASGRLRARTYALHRWYARASRFAHTSMLASQSAGRPPMRPWWHTRAAQVFGRHLLLRPVFFGAPFVPCGSFICSVSSSFLPSARHPRVFFCFFRAPPRVFSLFSRYFSVFPRGTLCFFRFF
eukprot:GEMP01052265.1.p1 GENE.GEMP01052265.1~~GEMP01052265.1.p1  ORF type:complete len:217 (-),score=40.35 GEMP01052265.1:146-796(-)